MFTCFDVKCTSPNFPAHSKQANLIQNKVKLTKDAGCSYLITYNSTNDVIWCFKNVFDDVISIFETKELYKIFSCMSSTSAAPFASRLLVSCNKNRFKIAILKLKNYVLSFSSQRWKVSIVKSRRLKLKNTKAFGASTKVLKEKIRFKGEAILSSFKAGI
jgi:hypothetical protein